MAASMVFAPGLPVLGLTRPRHAVDHLHFALRNDAMLIVAQDSTKEFICHRLMSEFTQRSAGKKCGVLLTNDYKDQTTIQLVKILMQFLPEEPVTYFKNQPGQLSLQSLTSQKQNTLVTSPDCLLDLLNDGCLKAEDISLVIFNFSTILYSDMKNCPYKQILHVIRKEIVKPRIVGLMHLKLGEITNALDLNQCLDNVESMYGLPVHLSTDLLAMNNFGEEIAVETLGYDTNISNTTTAHICSLLKGILKFLCDINLPEPPESFRKLKAIIAWSIDVLVVFGLWSFQYKFKTIQKSLESVQTNGSLSILVNQFCKSQFELIEAIMNSNPNVQSLEVSSQLIYNICDTLTPYEVFCNNPSSNSEQEDDNSPTNEQNYCTAENLELQGNKSDEQHPVNNTWSSYTKKITLEVKSVKLQSKAGFCCIIVTAKTSSAKLLSKQINYLSSCNKKYSFLKATAITQSRKDKPDAANNTEGILRAVEQGVLNVLVTTRDLCCNMIINSCNVLVYFGMPDGYAMYFTLKQKARGIAGKFIVVLPDKELASSVIKLQFFKDIERSMEKRVPDFISFKRKESWLKCLAEDSLPCYAPFGDDGPRVSMVSAIHIINRYCEKISKRDYSAIRAQFLTEKKDVTHDTTELSSTVCLPLGCSCQGVIKGPSIRVCADDDLDIAILKSNMAAALECVKVLDESGYMDDELELTEIHFVERCSDEITNCELKDEGKGRAGTNKRKRAYEIKVPSFYKDNMPRTNETFFLYEIELEYSESLQSCSEFEHRPDSEIQLGILSRKPLPSIPKFTIYPYKCEATVSITATPSGEDRLDDADLKRIRDFHEYVFQSFLKLNHQFSSLSKQDGCLIVPVKPVANDIQIHFSFLEEFELMTSDEYDLSRTAQASKDFSVFENKVIQNTNKCANKSRCVKFFVVDVCKDLNPGTAFPDLDVASTFAEYYLNRYGLEVNPDQPLLRVKYAPARVNFLFPRSVQKDRKSSKDKNSGDKNSEDKSSEDKISEDKSSEDKSSGDNSSEDNNSENNNSEDKSSGDKNSEDKSSDDKSSDDKNAEGKDSEGKTSEDTSFVKEKSRSDIHLIPELCSIAPLSTSAWRLVGCLPTIVYRLSTFLLAEELRCRLHVETGIGCEVWPEGLPVPELGIGDFVGEDRLSMVSQGDVRTSAVLDAQVHDLNIEDSEREGVLDELVKRPSPDKPQPSGTHHYAFPSPSTGPHIGPCLTLVLRALTAKAATLYFHSERLELLGDSLLKLEVSLELFLSFSEKDEWALSVFRGSLVSNDMLSKQGRRLGLPGFMTINLPDIAKNPLLPGFALRGSSTQPRTPDLNTIRHQVMGDKNVANCVEALIGAYLISCGRGSARRIMVWFGVLNKTLEELEDRCKTVSQNFDESSGSAKQMSGKCDSVFSPKLCSIPELSHIEEEVGYRFKNKHLLVVALTHSSYSRPLASVTESYQRLEFLGDAVLDYLVTLHLYSRFPHFNHGDLTDFRSALVNNFTVAFLAVQNRLHQAVRCMSPLLVGVMARFVEFLEEQKAKQGASWKTSVDAFVVGNNPDVEENSVEVPKILGDIFESLVAAVFLDSGMNIDLVWKVFYPMLQPFIDYYKDNIPRSPIRTLKELYPDQVTFSLTHLTLSKNYVSKVHVVGYGSFQANGRTSKIAKSSVARKALQHIRNTMEMK